MSSALGQLRTLRAEIEAFGSLPLLPPDDLFEYAGRCEEVIGLTDDLLARDPVSDEPAIVDCLFGLGQAMRKAGDTLTGADILLITARLAKRANLPDKSALASNAAGVAFYLLGDFEDSYEALDRALASLTDSDFGRVRSKIITLNRGNALHLDRRFEDAEEVFLGLAKDLQECSAEAFSCHSPYSLEAFTAAVSINLAANRCWWAQRDLASNDSVAEHVSLAEGYIDEALAQDLPENFLVEAKINKAHSLNLKGEPSTSLALLEDLVSKCSNERDLMHHLPEVYRFAAEARALQGDAERALRNCYRALESSLTVANHLEERRIVDTFVAVAHLSNSILSQQDESPAVRSTGFAASTGELVSHLVDFLERKDWYTGHNHSNAVANLSVKVGRVLCAEEGEVGARSREKISEDMLHLAGMLHDIGKLALPWSLLNKIVPLTVRERDRVRMHAQTGKDILDEVGLSDVGGIVAEHHERPDGKGYPAGKSESSLMGSILAVADVFEAMTTMNRKYRRSKSLDEAVREIKSLAGSQFDPTVARGLESLFSHRL